MRRCFIFGALGVSFFPEKPREGDFVIAADAGFDRARALGIVPDMLIGDFDSMGYEPDFDNIIRLNVRKDDTDVGHAIETARSMGYDDFVIYGAVGGKVDHTVANIQLALKIAKAGGKSLFIGEAESFTVIKNSSRRFSKRDGGRISVFSLAEKSEGVTIRGLSFEMENGTLESDFPLGVSNAFIGEEALVKAESGELLIVWENAVETQL